MSRITFGQKLDAIFRYETVKKALLLLSKSLNLTNTETLNFWIKKYQFHVPESLEKGNTHYTLHTQLYERERGAFFRDCSTV